MDRDVAIAALAISLGLVALEAVALAWWWRRYSRVPWRWWRSGMAIDLVAFVFMLPAGIALYALFPPLAPWRAIWALGAGLAMALPATLVPLIWVLARRELAGNPYRALTVAVGAVVLETAVSWLGSLSVLVTVAGGGPEAAAARAEVAGAPTPFLVTPAVTLLAIPTTIAVFTLILYAAASRRWSAWWPALGIAWAANGLGWYEMALNPATMGPTTWLQVAWWLPLSAVCLLVMGWVLTSWPRPAWAATPPESWGKEERAQAVAPIVGREIAPYLWARYLGVPESTLQEMAGAGEEAVQEARGGEPTMPPGG